jgi:hypothetical protein
LIGQAYGVSHVAMGKSTDIDTGGNGEASVANGVLMSTASVPPQGFLLKRTMKGTTETATESMRKQVLTVNKDGK